MSLVGLDVGTTGCRAIVFDYKGRVLGRGTREYPVLVPHPQWAEQDADVVWRSSLEVLSEALSQSRVAALDDPPVALALSVQGEAVIPVDADGKVLRPAILGMDTRTGVENAWLVEQFGAQALFNRTGMPVHTINTLPKLLWMQRHEPGVYNAAEQYLLYEDFFLRRLGGRATISHCLASRTQMYDLVAGDWSDDILQACHIERERLAPLGPTDGGVVGKLRPELARALGLDREILLVSGGHDQACAAVGSGVVKEGLAMVSTGAAEVVEVGCRNLLAAEGASPGDLKGALEGSWQSVAAADVLRQGNVSIYRHVVPGLYLAMTLNHSGGLLLRWFRDTLSKWEREQALRSGLDPYDVMLAEVPDGPTGLLVLPHFSGSGTPWLDTSSKGAILGLSFATTYGAIAKAMLEGLTFELRVNLDLLRKAGIAIHELRAVGGGARSALWLQLKADICQVPLSVPDVTEAACLGAALLAGVGAGIYPDLETAVMQTVRLAHRVHPRVESVSAYDARYQVYRQVYPTLIPLLSQL